MSTERGVKLSPVLPYGDDPIRNADAVTDMERAGLDVVWAAEAYSFDAVSVLGYLAARTERLEIGSAILPIGVFWPAVSTIWPRNSSSETPCCCARSCSQ